MDEDRMNPRRAFAPRALRILVIAAAWGCASWALAQGAPTAQPAPAPQSGAPADVPAVPAVWTPKQLRFTFMGFTATYSCDGLATKVRDVLLALGARPSNLKVNPYGCSRGFGTPSEFPSVAANFEVLVPLPPQGAAPQAEVVPAHWQNVVVAPRDEPLRAAGDCELSEQVKTSILPAFSPREVTYSSTCIPHQLQVGGTHLSAEVLIADPQPPAAAQR
jgi:hypothetical protein